MKTKKLWSRRDFLAASALSATAVVVAACGPKAEPTTVATQAPQEASSASTQAPKEATQAPQEASSASTVPSVASQVITTDQPGSWVETIPAPPKKYDPVLTIDCAPAFYAATYKDDETSDDNVWSRFTEAWTGLRFKRAWEFGTHAQHSQKWAVVMASGELPDVFSIGVGQFEEMMDGQMLEDVTAAWEATASPLLIEKKEYPDHFYWDRYVFDGRVYGIPFSNGGANRLDDVLWVRKDWLDQLGQNPPETLDDVATISLEWIEKGLAEFGLIVAGQLMYRGHGSADFVWGAFGTAMNKWLPDGKGGVEYGSFKEGAKDAIAVMRDWYSKGVLAKDFFNTTEYGEDSVSPKFVSGKAGMYFGAPWTAGNMISLQENFPDASMMFYDPPANPKTGQRGRAAADAEIIQFATAFKKGVDVAKVEAYINHMNWIVERYVNRFRNYDYMSFEGYDYVWQDGKVTRGDYGTIGLGVGSADAPAYFYPKMSVDENQGLAEVEAKGESQWNAYEAYLMSDPSAKLSRQAYDRVFETMDYAIWDEWMGRPGPKQKELWSDLRKIETTHTMAIITGQEPLDAFESMVDEWMKAGGAEVTAEVNELYQASKK